METEVKTSLGLSNFQDSDPTYEAWKLKPEILRNTGFSYSDPTYEAWKLT